MSHPSRIVTGALHPLITRYAVFDQRVLRLRAACENLLDGIVTHAFSAEEQAELTRAIYDANPSQRSAMFEWELAWFRRTLPAAPARILIGGAGSGREVRWLQAAGYRVDAFDPAASAARALARVVGSAGTALCGSYEDLLSAAARQSNALSPLVANRYDAFIAGWGSLSHLLSAGARRALFDVCHQLCPAGPILASFFSSQAITKSGRAQVWGVRLGRAVGSWRGLREPSGSDRFLSNSGVVHGFTSEELENLGSAVGRSLALEPWPYPHATWPAPEHPLDPRLPPKGRSE